MRLLPIYFFILVLLASCGNVDPNKHIDEGSVIGDIYLSNEIGWSIKIPKDWQIISKDVIEKDEQKTKTLLEKENEGKFNLDTKHLKHLISFQGNKFNAFYSSIEPFKETFAGEYNQNISAINQFTYSSISNHGGIVDSSSGKAIIQELEFQTFFVTVKKPDGSIVLDQIYYNKLINGWDFTATISSNNEQDKKTMIDAWENSKFNVK